MKIIKDIKNRIYLIDMLRGLAILVMILDHTIFDLTILMPMLFKDYQASSLLLTYMSSNLRVIGQFITSGMFLLLTGISCSFSKSNFIRGIKLLVVALLVSAITLVIGYMFDAVDIFISFGILHCISICLIIIGKIEVKTLKKNIYLLIGLSLLTIGLVIKYVILKGNVPVINYKDSSFILILLKEIVGLAIAGSDCYSLTISGGIIFIGVYLGRLLYNNRKPILVKKYINGPISLMGRHSLLIYLAHQAIIPIIMAIVLLILGYNFAI